MNFVTLMPYYYANSMPQAQFNAPEPQPKIPSVIMCISKALKTSLLKYEKELTLSKQAQETSKQIEPEKVKPSKEKKQSQPSKEESKPKKQTSKKQEKVLDQEKLSQTTSKSQTQLKEVPQVVATQKVKEQNEKPVSIPKVRQNHHIIKKDKNKHKKSGHSFKIPEIDLLDAAKCPPLGFSKELLNKKREKLLKRQVLNWNEKAKHLRDKRELRMLNF